MVSSDPAGRPGSKTANPWRSVWVWLLVIFLLPIALFLVNPSPQDDAWELAASEFVAQLEASRVVDMVTLRPDEVSGWCLPDADAGEPVPFRTRYDWQHDPHLFTRLDQAVARSGGRMQYRFAAARGNAWGRVLWMPYMPILVVVIVVLWVLLRQLKTGGMGVSVQDLRKSHHRRIEPGDNTIALDAVVGLAEQRRVLRQLVNDVRSAHKSGRENTDGTVGVLLTGPPGVGKSLLANAVANEDSLPLLEVNCCDFVDMFVGVGVNRMADLFGQAREAAPCMILLEKLDGIGTQRDARRLVDKSEERHQTLLALLRELDGLTPDDGVLVVGETDRPGLLDRSLRRGGRLECRLELPLPDKEACSELVQRFAGRNGLKLETDASRCGPLCVGLSPADIQAALRQAARTGGTAVVTEEALSKAVAELQREE